MGRTIATGIQNFAKLRTNTYFYIDKTRFIKDWWYGGDDVTLITRPRRFGKTLLLDTVKSFFSVEFSGQSHLFEGLSIWNEEYFRAVQGTMPVVYLSFANVKGKNYAEAVRTIKFLLQECYSQYGYLLHQDNILSESERQDFCGVTKEMPDADAKTALYSLSKYLFRAHGRKPILLLDEYDTPLYEAWIQNYWDDLVGFLRGFFNSTFKTNPWMERGLLTGITRIGKESLFSDLNNLEVVTTTSNRYTDCFGFTEDEVFSAMDEYGLTDRAEVQRWYDGFIFGSQHGIYNPWSIIGYLKNKTFAPYWAQTSSNSLVGTLIAQADVQVKEETSALLRGESIRTTMDEQIVFSQLYDSPGAIWSFLMAAGYVKPLAWNAATEEYEITLTNHESYFILNKLISSWFNRRDVEGGQFLRALLTDDLESMNVILGDIAENTFSFFDTGGKRPERFYHAFVLGLIVDLRERYEILSNRESGFGRFDILMIPKQAKDHGIVIEFKTYQKNEKSLEQTCANALRQIQERDYVSTLLLRDVPNSKIFIYGFAFRGKEVLICGGSKQTMDAESQY